MEEPNAKDKKTWKERINYNTIVAAFLVLFSIVFYVLIPSQIAKPKLFMGRSLAGIQPSLFPRLTITGLFALSIWYLVYSFRLQEKNLFTELAGKNVIRVLVTLTILVAYALLFEPLGFVISTALMAASLTLYLGNRNILVLILVAIVIPLAIFFIFTRAMRVSLPEIPFF